MMVIEELPDFPGTEFLDLFDEGLLPRVHLDEPDRGEDLVHERHPLVGRDHDAAPDDGTHFRDQGLIQVNNH